MFTYHFIIFYLFQKLNKNRKIIERNIIACFAGYKYYSITHSVS